MLNMINGRNKLIASVLFLGLGLVLGSCGGREKRADLESKRGVLDFDYAGKMANMMDSDSLLAQDSLNLFQFSYQSAALDIRLYELQTALTKAYFWGCHEQCLRRRCTSGDIIAAAMAYYLENQPDSSLAISRLANMEIRAEAPEINDIGLIINLLVESHVDDNWLRPYRDGVIKTRTGLAFWVIATIDKGAPPKDYLAILAKELRTSDSPSLKYAYAYALLKSGDPIFAWRTLPVYVPQAGSYAPPDFGQKLANGDTSNASQIYLTLGLYVIAQLEQAFLNKIIETYPLQNSADFSKIAAAAKIKFASTSDFDNSKAIAGNENNPDQLMLAIKLAAQPEGSIDTRLSRLADPVARAAFLKLAADNTKINKDSLKKLILAEIDNAKTNQDWERKILLTMALNKTVSAPEVIARMSLIGPPDSLFSAGSPEWSALYAIGCLSDQTKFVRLEQLSADLIRVYPYARGIEELVGKLKRLCRYD